MVKGLGFRVSRGVKVSKVITRGLGFGFRVSRALK